jgi:DNA-binding CsgD family transcriptional regulator
MKKQRLSKRQREILKGVALGQTNKEIAGNIGLSIHTVTMHRTALTKRAGVRDTASLTRYAIAHGVIELKCNCPACNRRR